MKFPKYFVVLLINITCVVAICGQQANSRSEHGNLVIQIRDTCGDSIKKALVQVEGNNLKRKFKSDKQGKFEASLPIGKYVIAITKYGFKKAIVIDVQVSINPRETINLEMEEGYASDDPKAKPWKCPPINKSTE